MYSMILLIFLVALGSTLLLLPVARWISFKVDAIDRPGGRKAHSGPVPSLGGLAVLGGLGVAMLVAFGTPFVALDSGVLLARSGMGVALAAAVLLTLGAVDEIGPRSARVKLAVELVIAVSVAIFVLDVRAVSVGPYEIGDSLGIVGTAAVAFWLASMMNAYNMIDGMDGLAGGVGAVAAGAFAVVATLDGDPAAAILSAGIAGALAAFLTANLPPAKIFLGDIGSLPVGFLLAVLGVTALTGPERVWNAVPALLILSLPAADILIAVVRRFLRSLELVREDYFRERFQLRLKHPPGLFSPDRGHLHHRIEGLGLDRRQTLGVCLAGNLILAGLGIAFVAFPGTWAVMALGATLVVTFLVVARLYPELLVVRRGLLLPLYDSRVVKSRWTHAVYDALAVAAVYLLTSRVLVEAAGFGGGPVELPAVALLAGSTVVVLLLGGVYRGAFRHMGLWQGLQTVAVGALAAGVGLAAVSWWEGAFPSFGFALLFGYLFLSALLLPRVSFRVLDAWYQRSLNGGRKTLIYGAGRAGHLVLRELLSNPALGMNPVGFLDDDARLWGRQVEGYPVLNPMEGLQDALRQNRVSDLVISSEKISDERVEQVTRECREGDEEDVLRVLRFRWRTADEREVGMEEHEMLGLEEDRQAVLQWEHTSPGLD